MNTDQITQRLDEIHTQELKLYAEKNRLKTDLRRTTTKPRYEIGQILLWRPLDRANATVKVTNIKCEPHSWTYQITYQLSNGYTITVNQAINENQLWKIKAPEQRKYYKKGKAKPRLKPKPKPKTKSSPKDILEFLDTI